METITRILGEMHSDVMFDYALSNMAESRISLSHGVLQERKTASHLVYYYGTLERQFLEEFDPDNEQKEDAYSTNSGAKRNENKVRCDS